MGWVQRGKKRYYYRSRRENGRTVTEYVGSGEEAEAAAQLDALKATVRAENHIARLESQAGLDRLDATLGQIDRVVSGFVAAAMESAGYHRHRGEWRKTKVDTSNKPPAAPPRPGKQELLANPQLVEELERRAGSGDRDAFATLLPIFEQLHLTETVGDVAVRSIRVALANLVGKNLLSEEATLRRMDQLRLELAGPNPTLIESLVVDRVVTMWFHLHKLEREYAVGFNAEVPNKGDYQRAMTSAQKRYFTAIRELVTIRRRSSAAPGSVLEVVAGAKETPHASPAKPAEPQKVVEQPNPPEAPEG
jgi:hypothetical protein